MKDLRFLFEKFILRQHRLRIDRSLEANVRKELRKIRGSVFLDIGANVGMYSLLLRRNFKEIIAVEANRSIYETLCKKVSRRRNIRPVWSAISDTDGEVSLYQTDLCDTILAKFEYRPPHTPSEEDVQEGRNPITVPSLTIDSLLKKFRIASVDAMKMDIEGAEFLALKGASKSLSNGKISKIIVELHDRGRKAEMEDLLTGFDFSYKWIDADHVFASKNRTLASRFE